MILLMEVILMSIFEAGMLICFGLAWPVNIYKSIKSKSTGGKSEVFLLIILVGYAFGITHKILYSRDIVLVLYIINVMMVLVDTGLYYRNKKYEAAQCQSELLDLDSKEENTVKV
jgi:hypothetical protein